MYPLPRMDDLLNAIGPIGCISTLDLQAGHWQIQIRPEDRDKTALVCPFGLYRFLRMPFGLRNAPASFQRLIDRFKTGLPDVILLAYLDHLIVFSPNPSKHLEDLRSVLAQMRKFQLRMNRAKCSFGCTEVKYLGHRITPNGNRRQPRQGASCNPDAGPKESKGATVLSPNLLLVPTIPQAFRHHLSTPKYTVKERPVLELRPR
jgi:hypothetical protein